MTFRVDRVAPVGEVAPHGVSKKLVMGGIRPAFHMQRMHIMCARHFLQADDIGTDGAYRVAQLG